MLIISSGGIFAVTVGSGWNREYPAIRYDLSITASTFLLFSGIFPPDPARTLSSGDQ